MSRIPSASEFINQFRSNSDVNKSIFKIATVTSIPNGYPLLKFDGENNSSEKKFACLASYTPAIDDRVLLASISGTYIILGKIKY